MPDLEILVFMGASPADVFIALLGVIFAAYIIRRDKSRERRVNEERQRNRADRAKMWAELKENRRLYHQTDKSTYGIQIAIQKATGIKLIKQSANGEGDHTLNRDVE